MAKFARNLRLLLAASLLVGSDAPAAPKKKKRVTLVIPKNTPPPTTPPPAAPGELPLFAAGAIVLDAFTGKTLYEKNADAPLYPASTTKIMTALLIIEAGDLDHEVEVTEEDSRVGESGLDIKLGERFTRRQMLYGLMLKSANDVAHSLARDNAGSVEQFAVKMTQRAKELGATNTRFRNPHGLHHPEHFTTARDLALISRAAMQQQLFRQVVATLSFEWVQPSRENRILQNHNRLLREFPNCIGVKTGFTNPAQHTLVTAALRGNREVVSAVLRDTRQGKWDDSKLLLTYGLENAVGGPDKATAGN